MAKQKGRELLIKIGSGGDPETFATICGLTAKSITVNSASYDVTTPSCTAPGGQLWQELRTGVRSMSISGNGLFEDDASEARLRAVALGTGQTDTADAVANFQVIVPHFGTFEGPFHVDSVEYSGDMSDDVKFTVSLSSAGYVDFAAA